MSSIQGGVSGPDRLQGLEGGQTEEVGAEPSAQEAQVTRQPAASDLWSLRSLQFQPPTLDEPAGPDEGGLCMESKLGEAVDDPSLDSEAIEVFQNSDYSYDDAVKIAKRWGQSVGETMVDIGNKVSNGETSSIDSIIAYDPQPFIDALEQSSYSHSDVRKAADAWEVPVGEAQELMGEKILRGDTSYIDEALGEGLSRTLMEAAQQAVAGQGDGQLSTDDASGLLDLIKQNGRYDDPEKAAVKSLRENFNWTPAADSFFRTEIRSWAASRD